MNRLKGPYLWLLAIPLLIGLGFIAATGLLHDAVVIRRDADIDACDLVRSVW